MPNIISPKRVFVATLVLIAIVLIPFASQAAALH